MDLFSKQKTEYGLYSRLFKVAVFCPNDIIAHSVAFSVSFMSELPGIVFLVLKEFPEVLEL